MRREAGEAESMQNLKLGCFQLRAVEEPKPVHFKPAESFFEVTADLWADRQRGQL